LIITTLEDIPSKCKYYLEHEEERLKIVNQAYDFVTNQLSSTVLCEPLLEALENKLKPCSV
ncbi:MAG: glycosyltransferase family 1 protein, partial [Cyanobacteria bacterium RM1_2_2]|nr:glycosyltransferase family 1 protein [Cyanobacteria bacterium RM1_2_2]